MDRCKHPKTSGMSEMLSAALDDLLRCKADSEKPTDGVFTGSRPNRKKAIGGR